jgi:hypothetical protein
VEEVVVLESVEAEAIVGKYRQLEVAVPGNSGARETNILEFVEAEVEEAEVVLVLMAAEVEVEVGEVEVEVEVESAQRMDLTLLRIEPEIAAEETSVVVQESDSRSALD